MDDGYRLVVLRRRDWLLQALSAAHATRTRYHFTRDQAASFEAMTIDPVEVLSLLLTMEQEDQAVEAAVADLPHVEVWYEDDLLAPDRQQAALERITAALGLPPAPARSDFVRVAPPTFRGRVANADEVAALLAPTRFARFLERAEFEV